MRSTPRSVALIFSIGFFLAFMILGSDAYRGSTKIKDGQAMSSKAENL